MRKTPLLLLLVSFGLFLNLTNLENASLSTVQTKEPQAGLQHEAIAVNIEVPVRVFKGKDFVADLEIEDFEIYEEGVLQDIEALYLIHKTDITREATSIKKEEAQQ